MQSASRMPGNTNPPVKIYNAVYSSVQVYECMVRGIAVMRRRNDSYVNATQILKVAGVDKGRRTKILEKEILPGKHEIVQGGYGKYQGTWIPLERGRDIALQYGVAPLLSPLFDFQPSTNSLGSLPVNAPTGTTSPRPLSASSSYSNLGNTGNFVPSIPSTLAPPPIMPGSALRLLNQGRAQGLFTPSTSDITAKAQSFTSPTPYYGPGLSQSPFSQTPPPSSLKRNRSEADADAIMASAQDARLSSTAFHLNGEDNPSPAKRLRRDDSPSRNSLSQTESWPASSQTQPTSLQSTQQTSNGLSRPPSTQSTANGNIDNASETIAYVTRFASKPSIPRGLDPTAPLKDGRRAAVIAAICQRDDPVPVLDLLREIASDPSINANPSVFDIDTILDDQGHTALHIAASLARQRIIDSLIANCADIHRGNYLGETPLIRACLATHNADQQCFNTLVASLNQSIHTLDTSKKSVLHHIVALAGVKGRAVPARYYLDQILYWIAQHQGGDFRSLVDLQDEHGDTALNIAARVGNRSLVRTLLDVNANRTLPNKLGLRPGDFGVETEELTGGSKAEDILSSLRSGPPAPVQKSQDVIADMTLMIQNLSTDFQAELKAKQDALDVTQAHLRAATRELSDKRKQIQAWQSRCAELDQINQRVRNVEKALSDEDQFDWTGRTDLNGRDARETVGPAFQYRGIGSTMVGIGGAVDISVNVDSEPPMPGGGSDTIATLVRLRRMRIWHQRMEELVRARLTSLQGASAEKEYQCKKIVALCTGIPIDRVEDMLENLVIAVESESQIVDIGRVSGFMQKVHSLTHTPWVPPLT
ncbi:apses-domain-containing protein [Macrolepiota fuliginosa MF-IS2]|uniref:Apses-domain-containing protein n=1 Tax=Macrolepiota fuliginosa MF-IS2 TaxID=1400762 RepID=A0A9P5XP23_9AGAR|nr:apses-domain-containing protein [Macrolepiota fuliginosa MF-IS2]